ncbi:MAG: MarR family transcriptional regulator [Akkermansia sp.]
MNSDEEREYLQIRQSIADSFNQINALYSYWARQEGINRNQLIFFFCMENRASCTPSELSAEWLISKQTLTGILRELSQQGFIDIQPNPEDKRSKIISLTPLGKEKSESIMRPMREMEIRYLREMGLEESRQLMQSNLVQLQAMKSILFSHE